VAALARTPAAPGSPAPVIATGVTARLAIRLEPADRRADNVIGILPGRDPALAGESVVIGAHYDHLGRVGGDVYHGADDNASGTAVVLGLARAFAAAGGAPRSLVFVLFSGEEMGLIGSGHYVRHPVLPLERAAAMVNFDMVGRLRDGRVTVSGVESGDALRALATAAAAGEPLLAVTYRESPFAPSDQARFYAAGVPVLFFTTGRHPDYHKPTDTADRLDTAGMARIAAVGLRTVAALASVPRPVYAKVAPPAGGRAREAPGARPAGGAFLGVTGDREGGEGVLIGGIVPGSGAERGGLRPGDVVLRIDDSGVGGFEDLVAALGRRRPGETARVVYFRDGEILTAPITLGERP
jgi:aminopeptidase YwaD